MAKSIQVVAPTSAMLLIAAVISTQESVLKPFHDTPLAAISALVDARNRGDVDAAIACYEAEPTIVLQPGRIATGPDAALTAIQGFLALDPTFGILSREILVAGDLALHHSRWSLNGRVPGGSSLALSGASADVLRRQPDGGWLVAIDNPWGSDILG